jgi:hypothetical protein
VNKEIKEFIIKLIIFAVILCGIHYFIFQILFPEMLLFIPIWTIYLFNTVLVLTVFCYLNYKVGKGSTKGYTIFLVLTLIKMALALVFLLPLFVGKSDNSVAEVINFFIPYFIFLTFEIIYLNNLLKND